jgi:heme/copper-type cytochrome/quinol oxidase subunit 1
MILKKIKVYHLFLLVASLILIIGLSELDSTFDINIHDTYFVVPSIYGTVILSLFYFLTGFIYWFTFEVLRKQLITSLTLIHSVILIGSFVCYWFVIFYSKLFLSNPTFQMFDDGSELINMTLVLELLLIAFLAIPIFIINLLIGLLRRTGNNKI